MLKKIKTKKKLIAYSTFGLLILILGFVFFGSIIQNYKSPSNTTPAPEAIDEEASLPDVNSSIKLLFVGDIMMARSIGQSIVAKKDPFVNIKSTFENYDLVIGNLETNISTPGVSYAAAGKPYTFNSPVESIDTLKNAGVDVVSLANNHTMDYYSKGLIDELGLLEAKGIIAFGAGRNIGEAFQPRFVLYKDTRIAFVGVNDIENWQTNPTNTSAGSAFFNEALIHEELIEARANADIVIVFPHWGLEYELKHYDRQEKFAKLFIDWGADVVIGAHPHVIQDVQEYNGKMIYYSLGNFLFDWMSNIPNASKSIMVELNIENKKITDSKIIKTEMDSRGWPKLDN